MIAACWIDVRTDAEDSILRCHAWRLPCLRVPLPGHAARGWGAFCQEKRPRGLRGLLPGRATASVLSLCLEGQFLIPWHLLSSAFLSTEPRASMHALASTAIALCFTHGLRACMPSRNDWAATVQWRSLQVGGRTCPAPRAYHTLTRINHRYLCVGGFDGKSTFADTWWLLPAGRDWLLPADWDWLLPAGWDWRCQATLARTEAALGLGGLACPSVPLRSLVRASGGALGWPEEGHGLVGGHKRCVRRADSSGGSRPGWGVIRAVFVMCCALQMTHWP